MTVQEAKQQNICTYTYAHTHGQTQTTRTLSGERVALI